MGQYLRLLNESDKIVGFGFCPDTGKKIQMTKTMIVLKKTNSTAQAEIVVSYPVELDISTTETLDKTYPELSNLLLYFLHDSYAKPAIKNIDTISRYISEEPHENINQTEHECRQFLSLNEFPTSWVINSLGQFYKTDVLDHIDCSYETNLHKQFIKWILQHLQQHLALETALH